MMLTIQLPSIRQRSKQVFEDPLLWSQQNVIFQLMACTTALDVELSLWYDNLPPAWHHRTVATLDGTLDDLEASEIWPGPVNVYQDVVVSNVINNYRMSRIFCQAIIIGCLARQAASREAVEKDKRYQDAVRTCRELVDGVCATVPFHLGYDVRNRTRKIGKVETGTPSPLNSIFLTYSVSS